MRYLLLIITVSLLVLVYFYRKDAGTYTYLLLGGFICFVVGCLWPLILKSIYITEKVIERDKL